MSESVTCIDRFTIVQNNWIFSAGGRKFTPLRARETRDPTFYIFSYRTFVNLSENVIFKLISIKDVTVYVAGYIVFKSV